MSKLGDKIRKAKNWISREKTVTKQRLAVLEQSRHTNAAAKPTGNVGPGRVLQSEESSCSTEIKGDLKSKVIEIGRHCRLLVRVLQPSEARPINGLRGNPAGWIILKKHVPCLSGTDEKWEFILLSNAKLVLRNSERLLRLDGSLHVHGQERSLEVQDVDSLLRALRRLGGFMPNAEAQGNKGI